MDTTNHDALASSDTPMGLPARRFSPMVALWGVLGALSVLYLGLLIARPEVLSSYLPTVAPVGAPESNEGQRAMAMAATQDLRDKVAALETEVEALRGDIASKTDSLSLKSVALDERLSGLEASKIAAAPGIPLTKAAAKAAAAIAAAPPIPAPIAVPKVAAAPVVKTLAPPAPVAVAKPAAVQPLNAATSIAPPFQVDSLPGVKLLNSVPPPAAAVAAPQNPAAAIAPPLVTGSLNGAPVDPVAKVAKPVGVYIGSGPTLDSVRSSWSLLSTRNADSLAGLQPRYTSSMDAEGMSYGLVAGPLKSTVEAQKVCKDLAAKAINCRIGEYGGEAL
jgi:hypothetical protein